MATPFNPFGQARGTAQAGSTDSAGRGRGASSARGSTSQPRGSRGHRATKWRGQGQGVGRGRGRGAGTGDATGAPHSTTSAANTHQLHNANSPFARLHQQKSSTSPLGSQQAQGKSPFSGIANARATRGARGAARGASRQIMQNQPLGATSGNGLMQPVPVEDASVIASYHERYDQLKIDRARERQKAIRDGQMADPNQPTSLKQAITPVGTCTSMCPEFERVERIVQKMVDKSEKYLHPSTNTLQNMETKMLKRFRRSAAGYDEQLPSDIRTPKTLLQSMNYLIRHVIGGSEPLGVIHKFVWDRTRSIRNDFSVQQLTQAEDVKMAVTCLERIARFHIVSLHLLSSPANEEPFDRHQEREQLNNTMLSLMYYYDDNRGRIDFPNEAEFRAYYILFSIHDQRPDLEARVQKWPASLLNSPRVQVALDLYAAACNTWEYQGTLDARRPNAIAQGFYTRFFNIINSRSVSYLMACVAEIYFNHVRQTAIRSIWKGYCRQPASQQHKNEEWTVEELTRVLHFDNDEQTIKFCEEQDLELAENANGQLYLNWGSRPVDSVAFQPSSEHAYSDKYVENKRVGRTLVAVILGMTIREAARMGMIDPSALRPRVKPTQEAPTPQDNDLFVGAQDNQIPEPVVDMTSPSLDDHQDSDASAPEVQQPSQLSPPSAPINPFATAQPPQPIMSSAGQPPNPFQAMKPPNPFSSLSSGATAPTTTPATTAPVPSPFVAQVANAARPFAPSPSPFSISKPDSVSKEETPTAVAPVATQPPSLFSTGGFATTTPAPATAKPNPFASLFSGAAGPTTTAATTAPVSSPFVAPSPFAPSPSSFSISKPATVSKEETPTAAAPAAIQPPLFSTSGFASTTPAPETAKPNPFAASSASFASTSTATEKPAPAPPSFGPTTGTFGIPQTQKPLFPTANAPVQPWVQNKALEAQPSQMSPIAPQQEPESTTPAGSPEPVLTEVSKAQEPEPPVQPLPAATTPAAATKRVNPYDPYKTPEERQAAWEKFIARRKSEVLAEEQARALAQEQAKRKRALEVSAAAETAQEEPDLKAAKVSEPKETPSASAKRSLLLKYLEEIPELPILKRTRELLEKKPPTEEEIQAAKPKPSLIDEDELLLNNARILAEQFRNGPSLLDRDMLEGVRQMHERHDKYERLSERMGYLVNKYRNRLNDIEARHNEEVNNILSGRSSSCSFSHSMSPPSHGYKVAYAPDPPPGGSLSRTEQRIRRTGARGLAYKPLNFPEKKEESKKRRSDGFTQTEQEDEGQDDRRKRRRDSSTQTD